MVVRLEGTPPFRRLLKSQLGTIGVQIAFEFRLPVHAMRVSRSEAITLRRVQATGGVGVGS